MYLVRSFGLEHLSAANRLRRSLISHFAAPFAQDETFVEDLRKICESPFEREVYDLLVDRGYRVTPQVKVGQYRIDMVVEGDNDARLAIECDGDRYHGADKWADDMQRQGDLERAGWTFWRCFASTFLRRRDDVVADLLKTLSELGIEPVGIENGPRSIHTEHRSVSSTIEELAEPVGADLADNGDSPVVGPLGETDIPRTESPAPHPIALDGRIIAAETLSVILVQQDKKNGARLSPTQSFNSHNLEPLLSFCRDQNLPIIDNRPKKGALWVVHPRPEGATAENLTKMGLRFADGKGWWVK
jgi:very-short-patch-repair endonuclease